APLGEKMIRKLRAGMMPPPGARRPDEASLRALADAIETRIDRAAAAKPNPGWRPFQRLNRAEYARAVRDLLALDVDTEALLPPDTVSQSFDNVADAQVFSPTLMEGYLRAASKVAALAIGDPDAPASEAHYRVPKTQSQLQRVDGAPLGHTLADTQIGVAYGVTTLPHLKDLSIVGPQRVTGVSDTASRRAVFKCRPTSPDEETTCASAIVTSLAARAFRRAPDDRER